MTQKGMMLAGFAEINLQDVLPDTDQWKWFCCQCGLANSSSKSSSNYEKCKRCATGDGEGVLTHERCRNCKIRWENDQSVGKSIIYPHDSDASPQQEDQVFEINYGAIKETALKLRAEHLEKIAAQANALTGVFEDEYGYPLEQMPKSSVAVDGLSGSFAKRT